MQRNQSFFASAPHLYIYDYFLSSRAKVRQNFGTSKLFLKKSLPQSIVFSPPFGSPTGGRKPPKEGSTNLREASPLLWRGRGRPLLPPFERTGVDVKADVIAADSAI